jgi:hypothetical protein
VVPVAGQQVRRATLQEKLRAEFEEILLLEETDDQSSQVRNP